MHVPFFDVPTNAGVAVDMFRVPRHIPPVPPPLNSSNNVIGVAVDSSRERASSRCRQMIFLLLIHLPADVKVVYNTNFLGKNLPPAPSVLIDALV